ncbi:MAG: general secretion pathway protein GspB [Pseudomonadota bacterium]
MSFILDALKKAESERSRHTGPVLMDVRIAQSRQRLPGWAWVLGCALLANLVLVVLGWVLLRKPEAAPAAAQAAAAIGPTTAPTAAAAPPAAIPQSPVIEPVLAPVPAAVVAAAPATTVIPAPISSPPLPTPSPRIDNLPTFQDLIAQGVTLPTMQLNLHVYDELPANRYVLLNARRLREGDEVADGIRVESIVPRGVVLNARGRRFVLLAGG